MVDLPVVLVEREIAADRAQRGKTSKMESGHAGPAAYLNVPGLDQSREAEVVVGEAASTAVEVLAIE
jgi:hypothetical protein